MSRIVRRSPIRRTGKPAQRKPLPRKNAKRAAEKFVRNFNSDAYVKWTRSQPCVFCGGGPCVTAHMKARGMGGCNGDWKQTLPVCCYCDAIWTNGGRETLLALWGWTWDEIKAALAWHQALWSEWQTRGEQE